MSRDIDVDDDFLNIEFSRIKEMARSVAAHQNPSIDFTIFYGRFNCMKTTIDGAGRVIVPKVIREAVQLEAGSEIDVRVENGIIQLEPIANPVKFKKRGHLLIATRPERTGELTREMVETTRESIRGERTRSGLGKTRKP